MRCCNPKTGKTGYYTQCFNRWDRDCHINKHDGVRCKDCELKAYKPVTPNPYIYGKDYVRMELLERLRKAGFEIRLRTEDCERFAVIDNQIVWFGSINLLSKEDAEDNIMRVCDGKIAAEVLELM